jgi:hypothetical protein
MAQNHIHDQQLLHPSLMTLQQTPHRSISCRQSPRNPELVKPGTLQIALHHCLQQHDNPSQKKDHQQTRHSTNIRSRQGNGNSNPYNHKINDITSENHNDEDFASSSSLFAHHSLPSPKTNLPNQSSPATSSKTKNLHIVKTPTTPPSLPHRLLCPDERTIHEFQNCPSLFLLRHNQSLNHQSIDSIKNETQ